MMMFWSGRRNEGRNHVLAFSSTSLCPQEFLEKRAPHLLSSMCWNANKTQSADRVFASLAPCTTLRGWQHIVDYIEHKRQKRLPPTPATHITNPVELSRLRARLEPESNRSQDSHQGPRTKGNYRSPQRLLRSRRVAHSRAVKGQDPPTQARLPGQVTPAPSTKATSQRRKTHAALET